MHENGVAGGLVTKFAGSACPRQPLRANWKWKASAYRIATAPQLHSAVALAICHQLPGTFQALVGLQDPEHILAQFRLAYLVLLLLVNYVSRLVRRGNADIDVAANEGFILKWDRWL